MIKNIPNLVVQSFFPPSCISCQQFTCGDLICNTCASLINEYPNLSEIKINNNYGAVFYYEMLIRKLIIRAKFYNCHLSAQTILHWALKSQEIIKLLKIITDFEPQVVTYVPTHWITKLWRIVDLSFMFAQALGLRAKIPVIRLLHKNKNIQISQFQNKKKRQEKIKNTILSNTRVTKYSRILLVDDIVTSGSTFQESQRVLAHKKRRVLCIALAKTP